jgi:hypothetical protein
MKVADTYPNPGIQFRNADAGFFGFAKRAGSAAGNGPMFDIYDDNY